MIDSLVARSLTATSRLFCPCRFTPVTPFSLSARETLRLVAPIALTTSRSSLAIDLGFAGGAGDAQSVGISAQSEAGTISMAIVANQRSSS
jgi:hypothetical protein